VEAEEEEEEDSGVEGLGGGWCRLGRAAGGARLGSWAAKPKGRHTKVEEEEEAADLERRG
jgi:hypothetical protein